MLVPACRPITPSRWHRICSSLKFRSFLSAIFGPILGPVKSRWSWVCLPRANKHRTTWGIFLLWEGFNFLNQWLRIILWLAMIIYRMVIVEGRSTKLQVLICYIYNHWLTQKYSQFWLVRYNGLVWSNIVVTFFYYPIYMCSLQCTHICRYFINCEAAWL